MTIAEFVKTKFVPEHVSTKTITGRTHYRAILKHVLTPEEVDCVFQADPEKSTTRLKAIPGWPYLDNVCLSDARPEHVERLISAAATRGYSTQTVKHIRNVVGVIFTHAAKERCFTGDSPASQVRLPGMVRKEAHALTLAQARKTLEVMQYPEKEITLIAILTNMNVAEICGLRWKCVNLTDAWSHADGDPIPPKSIAVRQQWRRGELASVGTSRRRKNLPIPAPLLPILLELSRRPKFTAPDDFVLVSRTGTPINESNIVRRRLKPIGKDLQIPWLSWQVCRRTHKTLVNEFGRHFLDRIGMTEHPDFSVTPTLVRAVGLQ